MSTAAERNSIPALDGLRAVACLLVVVSHIPKYMTNPSDLYHFSIPLGEVGVSIFFALSGFLMAHLYLHKRPSMQVVLSYLNARFSRIAPAYWLAVVACFIVYKYTDADFIFPVDEGNIIRHILFMGSSGIFWSIPPEIQYYLYFVFLWFSFSAMRDGKRAFMIVMLVVSGVFIFTGEHWPGITLPSKLHIFLLGSCLAYLFCRVGSSVFLSGKFAVALQMASLLAFVAGLFLLVDMDIPTFYNHSAFFVLAGGLVFAYSIRTPLADAMFGLFFLRWLGKVSFSIYLFHGLVIYFFDRALLMLDVQGGIYDSIVLVLSILIPAFFSEMVELPLCRYSKMKGQIFVDWVVSVHSRRRVLQADCSSSD